MVPNEQWEKSSKQVALLTQRGKPVLAPNKNMLEMTLVDPHNTFNQLNSQSDGQQSTLYIQSCIMSKWSEYNQNYYSDQLSCYSI